MEKIINNVEKFSEKIAGSDYDYIEELLQYYSDIELSNLLVEKNLISILASSLEYKLISLGEDFVNETITSTSTDEKFMNNEELEVSTDYIYEIEKQVEEYLKQKADGYIDYIRNLGYEFNNVKLDYDYIIDNICIEMLLDDDLNDYKREMHEDSNDYDYSQMINSNTIDIDDIFNQDYDIQ